MGDYEEIRRSPRSQTTDGTRPDVDRPISVTNIYLGDPSYVPGGWTDYAQSRITCTNPRTRRSSQSAPVFVSNYDRPHPRSHQGHHQSLSGYRGSGHYPGESSHKQLSGTHLPDDRNDYCQRLVTCTIPRTRQSSQSVPVYVSNYDRPRHPSHNAHHQPRPADGMALISIPMRQTPTGQRDYRRQLPRGILFVTIIPPFQDTRGVNIGQGKYFCVLHVGEREHKTVQETYVFKARAGSNPPKNQVVEFAITKKDEEYNNFTVCVYTEKGAREPTYVGEHRIANMGEIVAVNNNSVPQRRYRISQQGIVKGEIALAFEFVPKSAEAMMRTPAHITGNGPVGNYYVTRDGGAWRGIANVIKGVAQSGLTLAAAAAVAL